MENLTPEQQQRAEVVQVVLLLRLKFKNFLASYNKLSEACFIDCVHDFTNRKVSSNENNCAMHCTEKFIKVMQRVGLRLQEVQVMENEGLLSAKK